MKKQGASGLEELMGRISQEMEFDFFEVTGDTGRYVVKFGYHGDGEVYGIELEGKVMGPKMFQWVVSRVISYLTEDMARR